MHVDWNWSEFTIASIISTVVAIVEAIMYDQ